MKKILILIWMLLFNYSVMAVSVVLHDSNKADPINPLLKDIFVAAYSLQTSGWFNALVQLDKATTALKSYIDTEHTRLHGATFAAQHTLNTLDYTAVKSWYLWRTCANWLMAITQFSLPSTSTNSWWWGWVSAPVVIEQPAPPPPPPTCTYQNGWNIWEWWGCKISDAEWNGWLVVCDQIRSVSANMITTTSRSCPIASTIPAKPEWERSTKIWVIWILWWYNIGKWGLSENGIISEVYQKIGSTADNQNSYNQKWIYLWLSSNELSNKVNTVRKNSEKLCRWLWKDVKNGILTDDIKIWEINCYENTGELESKILLDKDLTLEWNITTIVVKWGNINMIVNASQRWSGYLNVFIDKWVMSIWDWWLVWVDKNWEVAGSNEVWKWMVLKWNYVINGIIGGWHWNYTQWVTSWFGEYNHRLYLHGSMLFLNTLETATSERKKYVWDLIWSMFTNKEYEKYIKLKDIFTRRCDGVVKKWTDNNKCEDLDKDNWAYNALVFINKNLSNIFFE